MSLRCHSERREEPGPVAQGRLLVVDSPGSLPVRVRRCSSVVDSPLPDSWYLGGEYSGSRVLGGESAALRQWLILLLSSLVAVFRGRAKFICG